jgi:hypothetical protein
MSRRDEHSTIGACLGTAGGTGIGIKSGAFLGTLIGGPGIGTVVGAGIGGVAGGVLGFFSGRKNPAGAALSCMAVAVPLPEIPGKSGPA